MKHDIHRWIHFIALEDVFSLAPGEKSNVSHEITCILCGRKMKKPSGYRVHLLTDGNLVSSDMDFDNSQGFHDIGNECKSKLPNSFLFKID